MERTISIPDRLAGMVVGLALIVVGLGFMALGVTFLPVIGILMGIPVINLAFYFLNPTATEHVEKASLLCPWPHTSAAVGSTA
jgi:hypothetical protein